MRYILFLAIFLLLSCKNNKPTNLIFLDEYVLADSIAFKSTVIGGLSGVDFANNKYYFVIDDAQNPRIFSAEINILSDTINSIKFKDVVLLKDTLSVFYRESSLDLESIFFDENTNEVNLISEGSIRENKLPSIFKIDNKGMFLESYPLPKNLSNLKDFKHNAVFEGSSKSIDKKGFWVAMESPLKVDGDEPDFTKKYSPIRITYYDSVSKKATKQFAYQLEHISKESKGSINLNGVTAILEYKKNHFFVVERTYQNEFGSYGNTVRIFEAIIEKTSTNILDIDSLKTTEFMPLKKRLLLDFNTIKDQLTDGIVDNIEGITFGPKLSSGNQSLLLVSDDNFQIYGKQLNQFILLEIKTNK